VHQSGGGEHPIEIEEHSFVCSKVDVPDFHPLQVVTSCLAQEDNPVDCCLRGTGRRLVRLVRIMLRLAQLPAHKPLTQHSDDGLPPGSFPDICLAPRSTSNR
jgi:uncharacterized Zn-finger protein